MIMVVKVQKEKKPTQSGYEEPVLVKSDSPTHETTETHPAYGMIGANRVSGNACLFGSDFIHNGYVTISICKAELNRGLSNDRPFGRDELIQVALSEAQWAHFVSTMNVGSGVQCTLQHINRVSVNQIPDPPDRHDQFKKKMDTLGLEGNNALIELERELDSMNISEKKRKELKWKVTMARRAIGGSAEFVADQFVEHMEKVTEHAKIEVNAYVTGVVQRAGLEHLQQGNPPIMLENHAAKALPKPKE